jgi:hypothetical protein
VVADEGHKPQTAVWELSVLLMRHFGIKRAGRGGIGLFAGYRAAMAAVTPSFINDHSEFHILLLF